MCKSPKWHTPVPTNQIPPGKHPDEGDDALLKEVARCYVAGCVVDLAKLKGLYTRIDALGRDLQVRASVLISQLKAKCLDNRLRKLPQEKDLVHRGLLRSLQGTAISEEQYHSIGHSLIEATIKNKEDRLQFLKNNRLIPMPGGTFRVVSSTKFDAEWEAHLKLTNVNNFKKMVSQACEKRHIHVNEKPMKSATDFQEVSKGNFMRMSHDQLAQLQRNAHILHTYYNASKGVQWLMSSNKLKRKKRMSKGKRMAGIRHARALKAEMLSGDIDLPLNEKSTHARSNVVQTRYAQRLVNSNKSMVGYWGDLQESYGLIPYEDFPAVLDLAVALSSQSQAQGGVPVQASLHPRVQSAIEFWHSKGNAYAPPVITKEQNLRRPKLKNKSMKDSQLNGLHGSQRGLDFLYPNKRKAKKKKPQANPDSTFGPNSPETKREEIVLSTMPDAGPATQPTEAKDAELPKHIEMEALPIGVNDLFWFTETEDEYHLVPDHQVATETAETVRHPYLTNLQRIFSLKKEAPKPYYKWDLSFSLAAQETEDKRAFHVRTDPLKAQALIYNYHVTRSLYLPPSLQYLQMVVANTELEDDYEPRNVGDHDYVSPVFLFSKLYSGFKDTVLSSTRSLYNRYCLMSGLHPYPTRVASGEVDAHGVEAYMMGFNGTDTRALRVHVESVQRRYATARYLNHNVKKRDQHIAGAKWLALALTARHNTTHLNSVAMQ